MSDEKDVTQVMVAGYESIKDEANKPKKDRQACILNRSGELVVPRRHSLLDGKLEEKIKMWESGTFSNPYRAGGKYWAFVEALFRLGINSRHSFIDVKAKMKELLSVYKDAKGKTVWEKFEEVIIDDNLGKDIRGKIIQNACVLQRIGNRRDKNPYGYKLKQLGCVVDILVNDAGGLSFQLRTGISGDDMPINEISRKGRRSKEKKDNVLTVIKEAPNLSGVVVPLPDIIVPLSPENVTPNSDIMS